MGTLTDTFGRQFHYLRLSVTEQCNFRCEYCLPHGCSEPISPPLSADEIERLVRVFAGLGLWKVRLTGGEPTIRSDIVEMVRRIAAVSGVRRIGLTTNGYRLAAIAPSLREARLESLNVSLDSLEPERLKRISGYSRPSDIVAGVEAAVAAGIPSVKVNVVALQGLDDCELDQFLSWASHRPLTIRFIELMRTGENGEFFHRYHLPVEDIRRKLESRGWKMLEKDRSAGPAINYGHPDYQGRVGIIAPHSRGFCDSCNRLRVSATGNLRLCLFGNAEIPLRPYLQSESQASELSQLIESSIKVKPASHHLQDGICGLATTLGTIGG